MAIDTNKQDVSEQDFDFLLRLTSLQHALIASSTDPVVLSTEFDDLRFAKIYYDCDDNEAEAMAIMKRRLELGAENIKSHYSLHQKMLSIFQRMDGAIVEDDRGLLANLSGDLCRGVNDYVALVDSHKARLGENTFLDYPSCIPGHYFQISRFVRECSFNPEGTRKGTERDAQTIREQIIDFRIRVGRLPYVTSPDLAEGKAGFYNPDFEQHLGTNKLLLEKLEFAV
jgi:hypothetical protein